MFVQQAGATEADDVPEPEAAVTALSWPFRNAFVLRTVGPALAVPVLGVLALSPGASVRRCRTFAGSGRRDGHALSVERVFRARPIEYSARSPTDVLRALRRTDCFGP